MPRAMPAGSEQGVVRLWLAPTLAPTLAPSECVGGSTVGSRTIRLSDCTFIDFIHVATATERTKID